MGPPPVDSGRVWGGCVGWQEQKAVLYHHLQKEPSQIVIYFHCHATTFAHGKVDN